MATNLKHELGSFQITASTAYSSGAVIVSGTQVLVVMDTVANGKKVAVRSQGVFTGLTKQTNAPFSIGTKVYFDTTGSKFTTVTTGNHYAGRAFSAAGTTGSTCDVQLGIA